MLDTILAAYILALAGCGGGSGAVALPPTPAALYGVTASNLEIATALYQDSARTPAGFYADPAPPGQNFVDTLHITSRDVTPSLLADFELCTDDWNQALQWSEAAATSGGVYGNLVGNSNTGRYFEFDRLRPGNPQLYLRQRVYLCSYLDRSNAAAGVTTGAAGTLNLRPLARSDLQLLSEYLWRFTLWNNFGSAVLASEPDPNDANNTHALVVASLVINGNAPGCDRVDVVAWRHRLTASNGALQRTIAPLWSFNVRQGITAAENCGP